ncbi:ketopantoate reductase family protein [Fictibacillus fluitans]|uniref:2-dehydropantoate 2-reductase n=1 Tax=Fictibacillus fluitans TaxID=3058422 RepID=A0ABT8HRY6_9BACL|nr:2-dehydropantoate 2-reductase [Fictibacillus sp. NE201]MDN4523525.1 2-dehydropantoate 2-reductase [Fictibacillus sp. NE201]
MRIAVIGGGAVGLLFTSFFSHAGFEVTVCTRTKDQANLLNHEGIIVKAEKEEEKKYRLRASILSDYHEVPEYVVVCVKQNRLETVIHELCHKLELQKSTLVFVQNGMGHIEKLHSLPQDNIIAAVVEHGVSKPGENRIHHTGWGKVKAASIKGSIEMLFWERMKQYGFEVEPSERLNGIMEAKLVANSVINPVTALFGVKNGEVMSNPHLKRLAERTFEEACTSLGRSDREYLWSYVQKICTQTGENRSSMLRDIEQGQETEIDAISGYVLSLGQNMGIELPYTSFVYYGIKALELKNKE